MVYTYCVYVVHYNVRCKSSYLVNWPNWWKKRLKSKRIGKSSSVLDITKTFWKTFNASCLAISSLIIQLLCTRIVFACTGVSIQIFSPTTSTSIRINHIQPWLPKQKLPTPWSSSSLRLRLAMRSGSRSQDTRRDSTWSSMTLEQRDTVFSQKIKRGRCQTWSPRTTTEATVCERTFTSCT